MANNQAISVLGNNKRVLKVNGILSNDKPIAVDLCCGVGGISLGIEAAGFEVALAVDIDAVTCQAYQQKFPHACVLCADVRDYPHLLISDRTVLPIAAHNKQQELASDYVRRLQELYL